MRIREMLEIIRQERAEEHERVRQEKEELRHLREEVRQQRKESRDYTALWVAILAAVFTGWQGWEAHLSRKDAHEQFMVAQQNANTSADEARKEAQRALAVQTQLADRSSEQAKRSADAAEKSNQLALDALHVSQAAIIDAVVELQGEI